MYLCMYVCMYVWLCWLFIAAGAFSSCGEWGLPLVVILGLLLVVASLVAEGKLHLERAPFGSCSSLALECRLSSCGTRA